MKNDVRIKEVFAKALEKKSSAEREDFLTEACRGEPELRSEVESLLRAHEQEKGFFSRRVELPEVECLERAGTMIGRYKLLQKIGEGGFGVVFMAEQVAPVQRKVALKIIKLGMDTREVVARFEAERQALALMDHPNVARVLDAGATDTGRPYFVMELVNGMPITDYCDREQLSTDGRLRLFMKVCHAVQHAHQKGIIHRDIKPNNVLVTLHDGEPEPKVIDFGVAKALGQKLTEKTLFTAFQHMIGTPAYMSPEQADLSGLDIDTRADIYSLGVLLYELLTGETPFDTGTWRRAALDEIRRIIRETEPPKPSTRVRTLGAELDSVARRRRTEPAALPRLLRGDLDWIVMKALEKDRRRRYETANAFASDVLRHLKSEPVIAAAPTTFYLFQKFTRRHKTGLATASALVVMLASATTVSTWQAARARRAEASAIEKADLAANEQQRANRAVQELRQNLYASDLSLVADAWQRGDIGVMRQLLTAQKVRPGEPDLRGFEWFYYWKLSQGQQRDVIPLDILDASSLAISADGSLVAWGAADQFQIFNWATRQTILKLPEWNNASFALSPDNRLLAKGTSDGLHLIEINTLHEKVLPTGGDNKPILYSGNLMFCPTGHLIAVFRPSSIDLWDFEAGVKVRSLPCDEKVHLCYASWSLDGKKLFVVEDFVRVAVWDVDSGTRETINSSAARGMVIGVTPDGRALILADYRGDLSVLDVPSQRVLTSYKGFPQGQSFVKFSADGQWLAAAGPHNHILILETAQWTQVADLRGHEDFVARAGFLPHARKLVTASVDSTIRVWDFEPTTDWTVMTNTLHGWGGYGAAAFSSDSRLLALATSGSATNPAGVVWDLATRQTRPIAGWPIAFSPDRKQLFVSVSGGFAVCEMGSSRMVRKLQFGSRTNLVSLLSPDGQFLASVTSEGHSNDGADWASASLKLRLYNASGSELWSREEPLAALAFSPDNRWLALSTGHTINDRVSSVLMKEVNQPVEREISNCSAISLAFSPDGRLLATAAFPPGVNLVDVTSKTVLTKLKGHQTMVTAVAFSPDGKTIASGAQDRTIRLYNVQTRRQLAVWPVSGTVVGLTFSPDGQWLVSSELPSGAAPGQYRLWPAPRDESSPLPAPGLHAPEPGSVWLSGGDAPARRQH